MNIPAACDQLAKATADLRDAVTEGRYADAKELLATYSRLLQETGDPEMISKSGEFIEWGRRLMLARRATLTGQLRQLTSTPVRSYRAPGAAGSVKVHALDVVG